ncbi:aroma-sacti cluster domain-containing protein [Streptomyces sp. 4N509B]|uniref:aroma-sacti cluster domain-containing protein n=1 Tax=Streptomyces sp. 4N509B TaxID=3457413 RepID=UPI003FD30D05
MTAAPDDRDQDEGRDAERVLRELAAAGFPVHTLTDEQRAVFAALAPEELALVLDIKARLDAVEPEVTAHAAVAGAALF